MSVSLIKRIQDNIADDDFRFRLALSLMSGIFAIVSLVMSILNIIKSETPLLVATGSFFIITLLIFVINTFANKKWVTEICGWLFMIAIWVLFTFFLITGGTSDEGFSVYWITILPTVAMLVYGIKKGSVLCLVMFLLTITVLWINPLPYLNLTFIKVHNWGDVFRTRFPLVYIACYLVGLLLEFVRYLTAKELRRIGTAYQEASLTDSLTGLRNQNYFVEYAKNGKNNANLGEELGCMFIDVDSFKSINDNYSHLFGNEALKSVAQIIKDANFDVSCRWGGDEFMIIAKNKNKKELTDLAEELRKKVAEIRYPQHPEFRITVSIGVTHLVVTEDFDVLTVIDIADQQSARAKSLGKNRVYFAEYKKN